jgi:hypothetical protein
MKISFIALCKIKGVVCGGRKMKRANSYLNGQRLKSALKEKNGALKNNGLLFFPGTDEAFILRENIIIGEYPKHHHLPYLLEMELRASPIPPSPQLTSMNKAHGMFHSSG